MKKTIAITLIAISGICLLLSSINKKEQPVFKLVTEERPHVKLLTPYNNELELETIVAEIETPIIQIEQEVIVNDSIISIEDVASNEKESTITVEETYKDTTYLIEEETYPQTEETILISEEMYYEEPTYSDSDEFLSEDETTDLETTSLEYELQEDYTEEVVYEDEIIWTTLEEETTWEELEEVPVFEEETCWEEPTEEESLSDDEFADDYVEYNDVEEELYNTLGQDIVNYALSWVGVTPYVEASDRWTEDGYWNDLYEGTDCSGFTHLIYSAYNIWLPYGSDEYQYNVGTSISYEELQPGDIVVYRYGGHVGIYAGDDLIVHCSNPSAGTIVSSMWYSTPTNFVRVVY